MENEIYKKQFSLGQILDLSWKIFAENFKSIAIITLIIYLPINIISTNLLENLNKLDDLYLKTIYLIFSFLLNLIWAIWSIAIIYLIKSKIDNQEITIKEAIKKWFSKWIPFLVTSFIFFICVIWLSFLLIIPAIIYSVYWIFYMYIVIFKDINWFKEYLKN